MKPKMYVIRKYIKATSAKQAILKDRTTPVDDVWVDEDWKKNQSNGLADAIGFQIEDQSDESNYYDKAN